ncbi:MAG: hypothetical protein IH936_10870 [Acidobacteria bacterium]|nr:hypothetical protein [Acidobacteriota bacterium]
MAHVTFFRMKAKPGERESIVNSFENWGREHMPKVKGFVSSILICNLDDNDEFMAEVKFETREDYDTNSNDKEQGEWFQDLRSHLIGDPDWFNGKLETESSASAS